MPVKHKYSNPDETYLLGPNLADNASGRSPDEVSVRSGYMDGDMGRHGMQMGASGFGVTHGTAAAPIGHREGGVRAGGVSAFETMPTFQNHPKQSSYDERRSRLATSGGVFGSDEPLRRHAMMVADGAKTEDDMSNHEMSDEMAAQTPMGRGGEHHCMVTGCGFTGKSKHGLTQHMQSRHSMGQMRRAFHSMGSSPGAGSSSGSGSSPGTGSSSGSGSSSSHGFQMSRKRSSSYSDGDCG